MKTMLFMFGAPGSGKSTIIKQFNEHVKVVSTDAIRERLHGLETIELDGKLREVIKWSVPIIQETFDVAREQTKDYCEKGEPIVVIDALNIVPRTFRDFVEVANKYEYEILFVDCMGDLSLETIIDRNRNRASKSYVSNKIITNSYERATTMKPNIKHQFITPGAAIELTHKAYK